MHKIHSGQSPLVEGYFFTASELNEWAARLIQGTIDEVKGRVRLRCQPDPHPRGYPAAMVNPNASEDEQDRWITPDPASIQGAFDPVYQAHRVPDQRTDNDLADFQEAWDRAHSAPAKPKVDPNDSELKTSDEWYRLVPSHYGLKILDPDGWDRSRFQFSFYEEPITREEFKRRVLLSTIQCARNLFLEEW